MLVDYFASFIDNEQRRNAAKLENIPFLAVEIGNRVFGVRQADIRNVVFRPVAAIGVGAIGANGENFRVTRGKGRVIIAQACEMSAAVGSHKSAQEDQNGIFFAFKFRKAHGIARNIGKGEIGSEGRG